MSSKINNRTAATVAATLLLSIVALGSAALCASLFPTRLPAPQDMQLVNVVCDSWLVIFAMRLLLVSAAAVLAVGGVYVVRSTLARMKNGDWLRRAGPFEVSEAAVARLEDQVHLWRSAACEFHDEVERLSEILDSVDELNEEVTFDDDYDKL